MHKERRERFETTSGIELQNDFNPDNVNEIDYREDLGEPGEFPYFCGVHFASMEGVVYVQ